MRMTASLSVQGFDIPLSITTVHNTGTRVDFEIQGTGNYQLANNTEGWTFMPIQGMADPVKMSDEEYESISGQFDLQGALVDYAAKGSITELAGKETLNGREVYNIKVTRKSGKLSNYYLDAQTYRLIKTSGMRNIGGNEVMAETTYDDYRQNADGYWFAYSITNMTGTVLVEKVETNIKVEESIFKN